MIIGLKSLGSRISYTELHCIATRSQLYFDASRHVNSTVLESTRRAPSKPWSIPNGMSWHKALENYARCSNPLKELPSSVVLLANDQCLTIFDGYEKAKFHFLVLREYHKVSDRHTRSPGREKCSTAIYAESLCLSVSLSLKHAIRSSCRMGHKSVARTCSH